MENKSNTSYFVVRHEGREMPMFSVAGREFGLDSGPMFSLEVEAARLCTSMNMAINEALTSEVKNQHVSTLNGYQAAQVPLLLDTATVDYALLNLAGEVGELMAPFAKAKLKSMSVEQLMSDPDKRKEIIGEIGDVLFMISLVALKVGVSLEDAANGNLSKLTKRKAEGKIIGSGNFR